MMPDYPWTTGAPARLFFRFLTGSLFLLMVLSDVLLLTFGRPWSLTTLLLFIFFSAVAFVVGAITVTGRIPKLSEEKETGKSWPLDPDVLAHQVDLMLREAEAGTLKAVIRADGKECICVTMWDTERISLHVPYPFKDDVHTKIRRGHLQLPPYSEITLFKPMSCFGLVPGFLWVAIPTHARQSIHTFMSSVLHDLFGLQCSDKFSISTR